MCAQSLSVGRRPPLTRARVPDRTWSLVMVGNVSGVTTKVAGGLVRKR